MPNIITIATKALQEAIQSGVNTLMNRLTANRAGNLDKLDATISSRATPATVWNYSSRTLTSVPSPIASIQTGFVSDSSPRAGSGEDNRYTDVTISAVTINKCMVIIQEGHVEYNFTGRLISTTNLRISTRENVNAIQCRWYVIQFA